MISLSRYVSSFRNIFPELAALPPWEVTSRAAGFLLKKIATLGPEYKISGDVAIHHSAIIENYAILKGPLIVSKDSFVGASCYLRGGVFLDEKVSLGPGCEVKTSLIFSHTALGHFNFVGDSILGSHVNMEAGSVIANHFNERKDKTIHVLVDGKLCAAGSEKFGALIGDHTKIGANAVLSPGTILEPESVVKRLALVEQHSGK